MIEEIISIISKAIFVVIIIGVVLLLI